MPDDVPQTSEAQQEELLPSRPLREDEQYFYEQSYKEPVESLKRLEEAAKFLVGAAATTSGLFLAAYKLSLGDKTVSSLAWFIPFICWALSIIALVLVLLPQNYKSGKDVPADIRQAFLKARTWKYAWLVCGAVLFIVGLISAIYLIIYLPVRPCERSLPCLTHYPDIETSLMCLLCSVHKVHR
jgi:hypothetical protein